MSNISKLESIDHHSYILIGNKDSVYQSLKEKLESLNMNLSGNPDAYIKDVRLLSVDHSRDVHARQSRKPLGQKNIFILSVEDMTVAAQNALLKIFEEPNSQSVFFLIVPKKDFLLETLYSRCVVLAQEDLSALKNEEFINDFLLNDKVKRLKMVDDKSKEFRKKDEQVSVQFLQLLEDFEKGLKARIGSRPMRDKEIKVFDTIFEAKEQLKLPMAPGKNIFEYLALITPTFD